MKKFFTNYLVIPKYGTVREKVFMTRIALGLTAIIFCMAALTYSAYAYFSHGVSSNPNKLIAANYSLEYKVLVGDQRPQDGVEPADEVQEVQPSDLDGTYMLKAGTYTFVMTKPEIAKASTGFCKIELCDESGNAKTYYTEQIGKVSATDSVMTRYILIEVKEGKTFVKLTASWGTCARTEMILTNGELVFTAVDAPSNGINVSDDNENSGENTEQSDPSEDTDPEEQPDQNQEPSTEETEEE